MTSQEVLSAFESLSQKGYRIEITSGIHNDLEYCGGPDVQISIVDPRKDGHGPAGENGKIRSPREVGKSIWYGEGDTISESLEDILPKLPR